MVSYEEDRCGQPGAMAYLAAGVVGLFVGAGAVIGPVLRAALRRHPEYAPTLPWRR